MAIEKAKIQRAPKSQIALLYFVFLLIRGKFELREFVLIGLSDSYEYRLFILEGVRVLFSSSIGVRLQFCAKTGVYLLTSYPALLYCSENY